MQTKVPRTATGEEALAARRAARLRLALIIGAVVAVGAFVLAIVLALKEESVHERWDVLEQLRNEYEPEQDPIWENPYGVYNPERERYIRALEKFLDQKAQEEEDALAPHTRFLLAKTIADHILSNPGMLDLEDRSAFYAQGVAQLEAIRDEHPDFPLNWTRLSPEGFPSLTRQFIDWFRENEKWEREHMLRAREPAPGVRVLIRTERGDLLMGLYREEAPQWTSDFLARATRGFYDGTAFVVKQEVGDSANPERFFVRGGGAATRGLPVFDAAKHNEAASEKIRAGRLPEESRNLIPHDRGIVAAWHSLSDEYDTDEPFLIETARSPTLDYQFTPVGKLVEEHGVQSLLTLDRIYGGTTWREDSEVRDDTSLGGILDWLQAPVRILKVLVYDEGVLREPGGDALPTRAKVEETEKSLGTIQVDRYKVEPPVRPEPPKDENEGEEAGEGDGEDSGDDGGAGDGDESDG